MKAALEAIKEGTKTYQYHQARKTYAMCPTSAPRLALIGWNASFHHVLRL